jgi:hypothetical protein
MACSNLLHFLEVPVVSRTIQRSTGNMAVDVKNPVYIEAEERVLYWLRKRYGYGSVWDARDTHRSYDFLAHLGTADQKQLDVKTDSYLNETGRVAFESRVRYMDGKETPGWGRKGLDLIAYVCPVEWRMYLVDGHILARLVDENEETLPPGWKRFSKLNPGRCVVEGFAIPLEDLDASQAIVTSVSLEAV